MVREQKEIGIDTIEWSEFPRGQRRSPSHESRMQMRNIWSRIVCSSELLSKRVGKSTLCVRVCATEKNKVWMPGKVTYIRMTKPSEEGNDWRRTDSWLSLVEKHEDTCKNSPWIQERCPFTEGDVQENMHKWHSYGYKGISEREENIRLVKK